MALSGRVLEFGLNPHLFTEDEAKQYTKIINGAILNSDYKAAAKLIADENLFPIQNAEQLLKSIAESPVPTIVSLKISKLSAPRPLTFGFITTLNDSTEAVSENKPKI